MKLLDNLRVFFDRDNEELLYEYWRAKAMHYETMYKVKNMKIRVYWRYLLTKHKDIYDKIAERTEGKNYEELADELVKLNEESNSE